jgi:hypothetical protein
MRSVRTTRPRGQNWKTFLHTHAQQIWACDAPACHRSLLPFVVRLFPGRTALAQSDSRGRHTISYGCLDGTYLFGKPPPLVWDQSTSSVITMPSLRCSSRELPRRVASRFSQRRITPCERMRSARFLGSVRRECLDHLLILHTRQLQRVLNAYVDYFNQIRPQEAHPAADSGAESWICASTACKWQGQLLPRPGWVTSRLPQT